MIIDLILDRYNGAAYNAKQFYTDVLDYENTLELSYDITIAMDYANNEEVQKTLCKYIDDNNYNANIKAFINAVNWLADDAGKDYTALYPLNNHVYNSDLGHIKQCAVCAAIAHQEIQNIDINAHIQKKTKEVFTDEFMKALQNNLSYNIGKLIDNI